MDCRDIERLIDAYLDRELTAEAAGQFEQHIDACPACLAQYGALIDLLTEPEETPVPAGLRDRIMLAVADVPVASVKTPEHAGYSFRPLWIGAMAACITLLLTSWIVLHVGPAADHGGVGPVANQTQIHPTPGLMASCAQAAALRQFGPAGVLVQAAAIDGWLRMPEQTATTVLQRRLQETPPSGAPADVPQVSILLSLSTLGV